MMTKEFIFEESKYFKQCHAATLAYGNGDEVLAAWFAGEREGADDVASGLASAAAAFGASQRLSRK